MKKGFALTAMLFACGLVMSTEVFAPDSTTGTQNLTYSIPAVSVFSVSGDVAFGTFAVPAAGSDFSGIARNSNLYYNVTNNAGSNSRKITVQIAAAFPPGMGMAMLLNGPPGASNIGVFSPTNASATTAVTGIGNGAFPNIGILMSMGATVGTTPVGSGTITATFTLTA